MPESLTLQANNIQDENPKPVRARTRGRSKSTTKTIIFSGDLGAPHSPLLKALASPWHCDTLIMESTYGDKKTLKPQNPPPTPKTNNRKSPKKPRYSHNPSLQHRPHPRTAIRARTNHPPRG